MELSVVLVAESVLAGVVEEAVSVVDAAEAGVELATTEDAESVAGLVEDAAAADALSAPAVSSPVPALLTGFRSSSSPGVRFLIIRFRLAWSRRFSPTGSAAWAGSRKTKARARVQKSVRASLRERRESISIW